MKYKNKTYLSPSFCDGHMIVYRKSIVKEKVGKLFDEVITVQEYITAAAKIGGNPPMSAVAMKAHPSEIFTDALPFLRMNGQDVYDDKTLVTTCDLPGIIQGLEKYLELKNYAPDDTDTYGNEQIAEAIQKKNTAMAVTWSGQLGVIYNDDCLDKEDLGFATFNTAWNVTWSFAISSNSENKEKANKLLRFLRSPEIDRIAGEHSGAPVRRQSYLEGMNQYPWYSCQLHMIENAKPIPSIEAAGDKNGVLYEEITNAFSGSKSALEAMKDGCKRINQIV
jgi:multiple sugar transport system substrate-binding protein